jgi:acyl-CoA:acyl-CoA alkyltransferase
MNHYKAFNQVSIKSLSHVDAPHRITSAALEDRLASTFERLGMRRGVLEMVAGIKARRFWDEGVMPSDAATLAGQVALDRAGIDANMIGALVNTSVCRDFLEPSTACRVHHNLGLSSHALNYDIGNACLGFINGMDFIATLIELGRIDYGIVVDGESSREVTEATIERLLNPEATNHDVRSQFASLTLGSGAAAMILCRRDLAPKAPRYLGGILLAQTQHANLCEGHPTFMKTDTKKLLAEGVKLADRVWRLAQEEMQWSAEKLNHLILHQVSQVHTMTLGQSLGLPLHKAHITFDELGNIGPAAVPITLSKAAEEGKLKDQDRIALMAIGSGLNCQMAEIVWGEEYNA